MTEQEFLAWIDRENVRAEWVDGEAFELMPPEWGHQRLSWFLATVIGLIADLRGLGAVVTAQFGMRLGPGRSYREPDVIFVAAEHLGLVDGAWLNGPADLAVEIVSEESESRDLIVKLREYATLGVNEYWILDPRSGKPTLRAYSKAPGGSYVSIQPDSQGRIHSVVIPGLWLHPKWFEAESLPGPTDALAEIWPERFGDFGPKNH
jgi:Uma2 family endonuclease